MLDSTKMSRLAEGRREFSVIILLAPRNSGDPSMGTYIKQPCTGGNLVA